MTVGRGGEAASVERRRKHHLQLEGAFRALARAVHDQDFLLLRGEWNLFEEELLRHLDEEERDLLPAFARHHPAEAGAIRREHTQIRTALLELGMLLDLHALRADAVDTFLSCLRMHAAHEDESLYRWLEGQAPQAVVA